MAGKKIERGIHELYGNDPEKADAMIWGRRTDGVTRRGFLKKSGLFAMAAALGASIPFADELPSGLVPAAFSGSDEPLVIEGKDGLTILDERPLNAEPPPHLLDDEITPASRLFIRSNGIPPEIKTIDPRTWTLEIAGESCQKVVKLTLPELKQKFKQYTYQLQLECGGNGRRFFSPGVSGTQWGLGAVGCPQWTGVRLKDLLNHAGIKPDAVYIGYYGADIKPGGVAGEVPISRGVPIAKALQDEMLVAWAINGQDIPLHNGYPLRLICSGWSGSTSGKWLKKIVIRNKVHDGAKMTGQAYRVPCNPVAPGTKVPDDKMCIIESMPVKSLITRPAGGYKHSLGSVLSVGGHAWAGDIEVKEVFLSIDFGATWIKATVRPPVNRFAWQHWCGEIRFPVKGYYEVWARAVDSQGRSQPMVIPGWNPKGYMNNSCHRIAVYVV